MSLNLLRSCTIILVWLQHICNISIKHVEEEWNAHMTALRRRSSQIMSLFFILPVLVCLFKLRLNHTQTE